MTYRKFHDFVLTWLRVRELGSGSYSLTKEQS